MNREAAQRTTPPSSFSVADATVILSDGSTFVLRTADGDLRAERAASCLLEPQPRDRVLAAVSGGEAFVLAVLVRAERGPLRIASDDPVELISRKGSVTLLAADAVDLLGARSVGVATQELTVDAKEGRLHIETVGVLAKVADVSAGMLRTAADAVERSATRLVERLGRSYRVIEGAEQVRAKDLDVRAESTLSLRAEHAVLLARKIVKVDATQIHMG